MHRVGRSRTLLAISGIALLLGSSIALIAVASATSPSLGTSAGIGPLTLPGTVIVAGPPAGSSQPDDIALMSVDGVDHGQPLIWTEFQNGINPNGTVSTPGGPNASNVVGFDAVTGKVFREVNITGHVDGVTADPAKGWILITSNEDANSAFYVLDPTTDVATHFTYVPSIEKSGNGGSDSIALWHGGIYISHSNPNDTLEATTYRVTLDWDSHVAQVAPLFWDDSMARFEPAGTVGTMALTDPDTNYVMPSSSPRYAGTLATISQGDGRLIFADVSGTPSRLHLAQLNLTDNRSGNLPPIDGLAVARANAGTLYTVDAGAQTITAYSTAGWPKGTVFVGEPDDNGNPLLGVLNLGTGKITPLGNHLISPKGMIFVPEHRASDGPEEPPLAPVGSLDPSGGFGPILRDFWFAGRSA
jgi:hypothetical protein